MYVGFIFLQVVNKNIFLVYNMIKGIKFRVTSCRTKFELYLVLIFIFQGKSPDSHKEFG
jgi:hypothetical protein